MKHYSVVKVFSNETLFEISQFVMAALASNKSVSFCVPNPDLGAGKYSGEHINAEFTHHAWRVWFDLAEKLECRFLTPLAHSETHFCLSFEKLNKAKKQEPKDKTEKYGLTSDFNRINKLEEADFLLNYLEAIKHMTLHAGSNVLSLGVNTGRELDIFGYLGLDKKLLFTGIDHSASALHKAKESFPADNYQFIQADINELATLELPKFDLVMALGTLQSPEVDDRAVLRHLVQNHVKPQGHLLFAFPNSQYLDAELSYGARMKNFRQADLSLVVKDSAYYRKYLHQHAFKVFITGKYYLFLTAIPA